MKVSINANFLDGLKIVLSDRRYLAAAIVLSAIIAFVFSVTMGLLYLTPAIFLNYYEFFEDGLFNIMLNTLFVTVAPIFAALTIALSVYKFNELKRGVQGESGLTFASFVSAMFVSTCQNCVPLVLYSLGVTYCLFSSFFFSIFFFCFFFSFFLFFLAFFFFQKKILKICFFFFFFLFFGKKKKGSQNTLKI